MSKNVKLITTVVVLVVALLFGIIANSYAIDLDTYADPVQISPGQQTTIHWNYQYGHDTTIQLLDSSGTIKATLVEKKYYSSGNNSYTWTTTNVPIGTYYIRITPLDKWGSYYREAEVKIVESTGGTIEPVKRNPPKLSVKIEGPTSLIPNGNTYTQSRITVKATITNTGDDPAYGVKASLTKTSGLALDFTTNFTTINLDTIGAGQSKQVTWIFNVSTDQTADRVDNISITASGNNVTNAYGNHSINVPGLVVIFIPGMAGTE